MHAISLRLDISGIWGEERKKVEEQFGWEEDRWEEVGENSFYREAEGATFIQEQGTNARNIEQDISPDRQPSFQHC